MGMAEFLLRPMRGGIHPPLGTGLGTPSISNHGAKKNSVCSTRTANLNVSDLAHRPSRGRWWVVLGAGAAVLLAAAGAVALLLPSESGGHATPPAPVSHVDTATRACLLTSTDTDPTGTWVAMQNMARASRTNVVVQRYRLPASGKVAAYVNTLVQLRCSTIVATGATARSAVASRLADGHIPHVRFVVVADQPVPGAMRLSPDSVSSSALTRAVMR